MKESEPSPEPDRPSQMDSIAQENLRRAELERQGIAESQRHFDEGDAYVSKLSAKNKKKGGAERSFAEAAEFARKQIKESGLEGEIRPYFQVRYSVAQGLKAAVHAREDGIATLFLQREILTRIELLISSVWVAIAILAFIAYKVA